MSRRLKQTLLFSILYLIWASAFSVENEIFTGKWESTEHVDGIEKPRSVLNLSLEQAVGGSIKGKYCFVTHFGDRIDCGEDSDMNMIGHVEASNSSKATLRFDSFFGGRNGVVELTSGQNGSMYWKVIVSPKGGEPFGPAYAVFNRVGGSNSLPSGERRIEVEKAYIYDAPSFSSSHQRYLVRGDAVKLTKVSDDFKFWKIEFLKDNGAIVKGWINCRNIDFCAK